MKLLLVEDDRIVRIPVRDALRAAGYTVADCADGGAALPAGDRRRDVGGGAASLRGVSAAVRRLLESVSVAAAFATYIPAGLSSTGEPIVDAGCATASR